MRVFVNGYWQSNLGDDLFIYITARRYPKVQFDIYATVDDFSVFKDVDNIHLIKKNNSITKRIIDKISYRINRPLKTSSYEQRVKLAKKYSIYMELGGSIFILPTNGSLNIEYMIRMILVNYVNNYLVIGSNFGPYATQKQLTEYKKFFKSVTSSSFRDEYSYRLFKNYGNVSYSPDVVFNLSVEDKKNEDAINYVLFSVINTARFGSNIDELYTQFVCEQIKKEIRNGNQIIIMSFCKKEGDTKKAIEIKNNLISYTDDIQIIEHTNILKSLKIISNAKKVFATRYHSMILGWVFKKPTFVVSYSEKTNNVIDSFYPQQKYVDMSKIKLNETINYTLMDDETLNFLRKEAGKQFSGFEKVINIYE
ncbi:polysaccharide pyruvyl transferase family protein [Weissella paramesenteroides]|nr:polysaccharide pyruvyl transferase family protein [Weissella paramesenteroides]